jgi:phage terminase large subunit GpA-like protein
MIDLAAVAEEDREDVMECMAILAEAYTFREKITLEQWLLDGNLILASESGKGGPFDLQGRPYQRGIVRAWDNPKWPHHCHCWAAQVGKSAFGIAVHGYTIDQDPTTMMIGFPDAKLAARRSRNMLIPTIEASPALRQHLPGTRDDLITFEYTFRKHKTMLVFAGSSASLSAETARILWGDEVAKWVQRDKKEGDPVALFWRRGTDWGDLCRKLITTTPNFEMNHGWVEYLGGTQHRFFVPCPHCGKPELLADVQDPEPNLSVAELDGRLKEAGYQVLEWRCGPEGQHGITGWGDERDPDKVRELAHYRCVHCGESISDGEKMRMEEHGKWIGHFPHRAWFTTQLPSWYSPAVKFGEVAERFFKAQKEKSLTLLQDWTNSDKAEPFVEAGADRDEKTILAHRRKYARGIVAFRPLAIICTVDVMAGEIYYEIGAHGKGRQYAEITHGKRPRVRAFVNGEMTSGLENALDPLMAMKFRCEEDGQVYNVHAMFIDDGFDTEEVHGYCRKRNAVWSIRGQENQGVPLRYNYPDQRPTAEGKVVKDTSSVVQVSFAANHFRDGWSLRWEVNPEEPGSWWLTGEEDAEYEHQLCGEWKKPIAGRNGRTRYVWVARWENHYFDCSVLQHVASHVLDVEMLEAAESESPPPPVEAAEAFQNAWATDI